MRRTTPGVLTHDELLEAHIAAAEMGEPRKVIEALEPHVNERRRARLHEMLGRRLGSVAVFFDAPYDPHNGAAVTRTCDAFGVQALHIIERGKISFLIAGTVSRGAQKWLDVKTHPGHESALLAAREGGYTLVATHPDGELSPEDLAAVPRLGLVLGNEREGIRPELAKACTAAVRVPMRGFVESLNVSVTAAILLYAATHGRKGDLDAATYERLYARGLYLSATRAQSILDASL